VETERDRVLSYDEIKLVWQAFDTIGWPFGPICKLLLLTGARRDEIGALRWREIDLTPLKVETAAVEGEGLLVNELSGLRVLLPRERVKNKRGHIIPLSDDAAEIFKTLPHVEGKEGFVFTTTGKTPVSGFSRAKVKIDRAILRALQEQAKLRGEDPDKVSPLPHWILHDLRRTVATNLQKLGVRLEVTESVLNHISGSRGGIVGVYQRHEYASEKRHALDHWAKRLAVIVRGGVGAKVLEFIAKARAP
jgi:integrase